MSGFRVFITPAADRSLRKLPERARKAFLNDVVPALAENPFRGLPLSEPFRGLRSFHFTALGAPYRVAYGVHTATKRVTIHYAGYRGGFYERLRRAFRG